VIVFGVKGIFLRITQTVIGGTLLALFVVLIVTGVERFTVYAWTPEYIVAALLYTVVFGVLWVCMWRRQRLGVAGGYETDGAPDEHSGSGL